MEDKFEVRKSDIDAQGIFALTLIKKGELVCRMSGEEISMQELKCRYEKGQERLSDPLQIGPAMYIDMDDPYMRFNHSCDPNAAIIGFNELIAIRDIRTGEEITYDYSLTEWQDERFWEGHDWSFNCKCASALCRGKIDSFYLLSRIMQKKQIEQGNVRDFIVDKYKKRHGE